MVWHSCKSLNRLRVGVRLGYDDGVTCSHNFSRFLIPGEQAFNDLQAFAQLLHGHLHRLTTAGLDFATFCPILVQPWSGHKLFQEIFGLSVTRRRN